jgi:hypothetical protein
MCKTAAASIAALLLLAIAAEAEGGVYQDGVFIAGPSYIDSQSGGWFYGDVGSTMASWSLPSSSSSSYNAGFELTPGTPAAAVEGGDLPGPSAGGFIDPGAKFQGGALQQDGEVSGNAGAASASEADSSQLVGAFNDPSGTMPGGSSEPGDAVSGPAWLGTGGDIDADAIFVVGGASSAVIDDASSRLSAAQPTPAATVVPEPGSFALLGAGLLGFLCSRRRIEPICGSRQVPEAKGGQPRRLYAPSQNSHSYSQARTKAVSILARVAVVVVSAARSAIPMTVRTASPNRSSA